MLAFGCDFLEGRDWLWLIPVLSKVGIWLQRKDSIVLAKQMDRSIVHNKRMADMLRCRESWIVKHVRKVHLPKPSWHPQSIPRLLPPTTESSPQSCLTLYLSYWVSWLSFFLDHIGQDFPFVDKQFWNWSVQRISNGRGSRVCVFQQLMLPSALPVCWRVR